MSARILLAGTHSSVGKTTVALGLLAAWQRQGLRPAPFKAGPDYIDPGLHAEAAGRPSRNLDVWLLDEVALRGVFRRGMRDADLAVIEGVMGLFDGIGATQDASTAALARTLECPVILVLDVAAMSGTAAALVLGCQRMQPGVQLAGVVLNRVGSEGHLQSTAEAIHATTGLPVLGSLPADPALAVPERHLGLVPAIEGGVSAETVDRLADLVAQRFDLAAIHRIAQSARGLPEVPAGDVDAVPPEVRIGVAQDRAFGFYYQDTIDVLRECGAEIVPFSPLGDEQLPADTDGLYLGGGFPELYAAELGTNAGLRAALREHARQRRPIYAECGGLMALGQSLTTFEGETLSMFGLLPLDSRMQREKLTIGYREVEALRPTPLMPAGAHVRGHEFHWSVADPPPASMAAYRIVADDRLEGFCKGATLGSYVHLNLAGAPEIARRFVASCAESRRSGTGGWHPATRAGRT
ncbi:MAG TPA: cobyrinate a,c-diamide synthase [Chloroflexota bacterium]|nr:cobyrinate a,c-diamide synthase [Chloroflexota bacterium]